MSNLPTRLQRLEQHEAKQAHPLIRFSHELIAALLQHRAPIGYTPSELSEIERTKVFTPAVIGQLQKRQQP